MSRKSVRPLRLQPLAFGELAAGSPAREPPEEPERNEQQSSCQYTYDYRKYRKRRGGKDWLARTGWSACRRRIEAGDDKVRRPADSEGGDNGSSGKIEHDYLAIRERDKAELSIVGDSYRLRRTADRENTRRLARHHGGIYGDRGQHVEPVALLIGHVYLSSGLVEVHPAKFSAAEQRANDLARLQVHREEGMLARRDVCGETARDADVLRAAGHRNRAEQLSRRVEDGNLRASCGPDLIGSRGSGILPSSTR